MLAFAEYVQYERDVVIHSPTLKVVLVIHGNSLRWQLVTSFLPFAPCLEHCVATLRPKSTRHMYVCMHA